MTLSYSPVLFLLSPDTSSFLIYNEEHNICLKAVSATVLHAAPCNVLSEAQHFRWISSSQIISLSFNLCLGAKSITEMEKIVLLPCYEFSPEKTWECKNETLFGLKGHPLHLNYGHRNDSNLILYKGTGSWSHWLIYETKKSVCSHGYQEIYTTGGNSLGKPCQFPFKYSWKWYSDCTVDGRTDGQLWCSTERDYDTDGKWGFCPPKEIYTTGGNSLGKPCQFPFKYKGKWYSDCTVDDSTDGQLWCSTERDYDTDGKWGFCRPKEIFTTGGNSLGKPCQFPFKYKGKWYSDCTVDDSTDGQLWCSTEKDYDTDGKWGFCPPKEIYTTGGNSLGKPCQFPFKYKGKWYFDCTVDDSTDGQLWCSTERDYDTDGKWGFCPPKDLAEDQPEEGLSSFSIYFFSFIMVGVFIMTAAVILTNVRSKT